MSAHLPALLPVRRAWLLTPLGALGIVVIAALLPEAQVGRFTLFIVYWLALQAINVVFGYAGQFSLAQNLMIAAGAVTYMVAVNDSWPALAAAAFAVVVTVTAGAVIWGVASRVRGLILAVVTLGTALATPDLLGAMQITGGFSGLSAPPLEVGGQVVSDRALMIGCAAVGGIVFWLLANLLRSSWGVALRILGTDEDAAAGLGLPPSRYRFLAFAVSSVVLGIAGPMFAITEGYVGYQSFPLNLVLLWFVGVVLGGAGSLWGPLIGAAFVAYIPTALPVSTSAQPVVWGLLLVVLISVAPRGLAGVVDRIVLRRRVIPQPDGGVVTPATEASVTSDDSGMSEDLVVRDVTVRIGGATILDAVSLTVEAGSVHALLGANGAGKSTFVNVVTGYVKASSGHVYVGDREIGGRSPATISRYRVARTFQHGRLSLGQTVRENLLAGIHARTRQSLASALIGLQPPVTQRGRIDAVLILLGIEQVADTSVEALPMGLRQLVAVGRALMTDPRILLLDEPAAGLSTEETEHIAAAIRAVKQSGVGVLVIDHRLDFVRSVAETATCLDTGRVIAVGGVESVLADPAVRRAFVGGIEPEVVVADDAVDSGERLRP